MTLSRTGWINLIAAVTAIVLAVAATTMGSRKRAVSVRPSGQNTVGSAEFVQLADGQRALLDAARTAIPLLPYRRIVSGSTVSDWLLVELCEPDRIRAVTQRSLASAPWRHRFADKSGLASLNNVEAILAMKPDLLLIDSFGDPSRVARLRERGLAVFDMGQMRGLATLWPTIERIGALCGRHERARRLAWRWRQTLAALAASGPAARRRALYLSPYGSKLFGGTRGTGYHDLLHHGGLIDAAADRFSDFPEYSVEQILALDPDVIVTRSGTGAILCRMPGLGTLRACETPDAIIELPEFSIDDPGLGLLESIENLYWAVHKGTADSAAQSSEKSSSAPAGETRE